MSCVGKQINHWTARDVPLFFLAGQIHQRRILQPPLQKIYVRLSTYQRSGLGLYINFHLILLFLMHLASPVFCWGRTQSPSCNDLERLSIYFFNRLPTTVLCSVSQCCSANQDFQSSLSRAWEFDFLGLLLVTTRLFTFFFNKNGAIVHVALFTLLIKNIIPNQ